MTRPVNDPNQQERIQRQIAFASGLFQNDVTVLTFLESIAEGLVVVDASGIILMVNPAAEKMFGYPREEIIGQPHSLLVPERYREVHLAHEARYFAAPCIRPMGQLLELAGRRRDGSEFPIELSLGYLATVNGILVLALVSDMTLRREFEVHLRDTVRKADLQKELILASAGEGIIGLDMDGNQTFVNASAAAMLGFDVKELLGKPSHATWHSIRPDGSPYPAEECPIYAAYKDGAVHSGEETFLRKDDGPFPVDFTSRPILTDGGVIVGAVVTFNDISERKRMLEEIERLNSDLAARAAELEAANRELEAFNYTVAHDLRKPLTVINGYCELIREICGSRIDEECRGYLKEAYDGTWRMNRLIEALLNFSRLARADIRRSSVDLSALVTRIAGELQSGEPERRVSFRVAEGVVAECDGGVMQIALDNLLGNAWKYTSDREEAIIEFGVRETAGQRVFFIRDNGEGFDMADADKLFTPFQRLADAGKFAGHGIGLATVERIIQRHGGRVWAEGERGKGATFYFVLPEKEARKERSRLHPSTGSG